MKWKIKLLIIGVILLILFIFFGVYHHESNLKSLNKNPTNAGRIQSIKGKEETDSSDTLISGLFTSYNNKFSIKLISNWTIQKGEKDSPIVVRCYQQDSGKKIEVYIYEFPNIKFDRINSYLIQLDTLQDILISAIHKDAINPKNLNFSADYLGNRPAIVATFNVSQKFKGNEVDFFIKQIQCFNKNKLFKLSFAVPRIYYVDTEEDRIDEIIKSVQFSN